MSIELPTAPATTELPPKLDVLGNDIANDQLGIGTRAARGGAIVFASMLITRAMNLLITAILARLLAPNDFGLIGMAFTLTGLLTVFGDMGLATATIQRSHVTHAQVSSGFWLNVLFGCLLAAITASIAPLLAKFYQQPVVAGLTVLCGLGFPLAALGAQHSALLIRRLEFGKIAVSEVLAIAVSGVVAAIMAYQGFGAYALVGQQLSWLLTIAAMAWMFSGWLPSMAFRRSDLAGTLRFGGYLTAFNFVNYFSRNFDNVLVGRFAGATPLGLYTRAYALMMYPISLVSAPISRVATPTLSKFQDDQQRMRDAFVRVLKLIGFISFPMMTLLFVLADDVIRVIYGSDWSGAVPIFRVLCIAGLYQGIYSATGQIFIATGRTDRMFYGGAVIAACLAAAFGIGIRWGALGVASAYAIVLTLILLPYLAYAYSTIRLKLRDVAAALIPAFLGSAVLALVAWTVMVLLHGQLPAAARITVVSIVSAGIYFGLFLVLWRDQLAQMNRGFFDRAFPRLGSMLGRALRAKLRCSEAWSDIDAHDDPSHLPRVVHLVYREGLSSVIESTVIARVRCLCERGVRTQLAFFVPLNEFTSRRARSRWRERLAVMRERMPSPVHRLISPPIRTALIWSDSSVLWNYVQKHFGPDEPIIFHCRGSKATQLALRLREFRPNVGVIFDMRGLEADEYLYSVGLSSAAIADARVKPNAQALFDGECTAAQQADALLCVSRAMVEYCVNRFSIETSKARVIPCGVETIADDLETHRKEARDELHAAGRFVVAFCGSSHAWQMPQPSIELFKRIGASRSERAHFLALTTSPAHIRELLQKAGVSDCDATVLSVPHSRVRRYLAAADIGLLLRASSPVNSVASPVKFGEFMAAGLPVIISDGVGDFSDLVQRENVGIVVRSLNDPSESERLRQWLETQDRDALSARCLDVARRHLDLDRQIDQIIELYRSLSTVTVGRAT